MQERVALVKLARRRRRGSAEGEAGIITVKAQLKSSVELSYDIFVEA